MRRDNPLQNCQKLKACNIISVGKRRDGGTKYWCLEHKADATAKYGKESERCRYADVPPISKEDEISINVEDYPGGIALWGAVPAVYDTSTLPLDRGIHVHARLQRNGEKVIDRTFRKVNVIHEGRKVEIEELDAIYYMVSSIFGFEVKLIKCTRCGYPHLDKDWFSVHPHVSHLCSGCGRNFRDTEIGIGNPIASLQSMQVYKTPKQVRSKKKLKITQKDYAGGIQIWGSNPSILWTSNKSQETGIHVHAYNSDTDLPSIDDTFAQVEIDGYILDEVQVRTYMAQMTLPHISERVRVANCIECHSANFDVGADAYQPKIDSCCAICGAEVKASGKLRKVVSNPIISILEKLSLLSPRPRQIHDLGLLPETI